MIKLFITACCAFFALCLNAQTYPPKDTPQLFICAPEWSQEFKGIVLNVWKVK